MSDCLGHLQDKHAGSQYVALKNMAKFSPPWTVPRDLWMTAGFFGTQVSCLQGPISPFVWTSLE